MKDIIVKATSIQDVYDKIKSKLKIEDEFRIVYKLKKENISLDSLDDIPYRHPIQVVVLKNKKGPQITLDIPRPWLVDSSLNFTTKDKYKFLISTLDEHNETCQEIYNLFKETATNEEITRIELIKNPLLESNFENRIILIHDRRSNDTPFNTQWEDNFERQEVMDRFNKVCIRDEAYGKAKLLRTWIGCSINVINDLCNTGPANLRIRDKGFFWNWCL